MTRDDLIRFALRDWAAVADAKERHWLRRRQQVGYDALLQVSDDLLRHARAASSTGAVLADRLADAAVHQRVGESLRAVALTAR